MRKGTWAPRVRARWCKTNFSITEQQWPVWIQPNIFGIYTYFVGPLPVPVTITSDDFDIGCWSYVPSTCSIRWEGNWSAIAVSGRWAIEARADYNLQVTARMGLQWTDIVLGGGSGMSPWSTDVRSDFIGPITLALPLQQDFFAIAGTAIMAVNGGGHFGKTYLQIFQAGIDAENTEPVTWAAPTDPW